MNFSKFLASGYKDLPIYNIRGSFNVDVPPVPPAEEPKKKPELKGNEYIKDILKNHNIFTTSTVEDTADDASTNLSHIDEVSGFSALNIESSDIPDKVEEDPAEFYKRIREIPSQNDDPHLEPIRSKKKALVDTIDQNRVTLVTGPTGCGKTTQIPQFVFDAYRNKQIHCNIIISQPRRIAAISVAKRVSQERQWPLGSIVGYKVSMNSEISSETRLTYCTAGILLQILIQKKFNVPFTHIFVDEVHERNDETDFLLIILKWMLSTRKTNLKVILMSATMDTKKFADYFSFPSETYDENVCGSMVYPPVVSVTEKTSFNVEITHINEVKTVANSIYPVITLDNPWICPETYRFAAELIKRLSIVEHDMGPAKDRTLGGVLVFLPGFHEIETFFEILSEVDEKIQGEKWSIFPLHSTTAFEEQSKVFEEAPKGTRKIILATNIAESSLTVKDVTYIIDFCLVKMSIQKEDTNYSSLKTSWISKSQGAQRAGRVGRVSDGSVIRLVPKNIYESFEDECAPEIQRCPLDILVLRAKQLGLGPPAVVLAHALDPPKLDNIQRTILNLKEMGALHLTSNGVYTEDDGDFTSIGAIMTTMPFDTHLSKLIIMGHLFGCLEDCIIMACAMSVKSVFSNPFKKQLEAYNSRLSWSFNSSSDPLSFLNVYKLHKEHNLSGRFNREGALNEHAWARRQFIQLRSLKEIECLEKETITRLKNLNISLKPKKDEPIWTKDEKPLILKIVLAASCYPNYFLCAPIIEEDAVKTLNGNNPYSTVYLKNFPINQPKLLYQEVIRKKFLSCGSGINVSFDGSQKVYIHFENSATNSSSADQSDKNSKILLAIYRAVKMNQIKMPIEIPLLKVEEAHALNTELFGDNANQLFLPTKPPADKCEIGMGISVLNARLSSVVNPQCFWVHLDNEASQQKLLYISNHLINPDMMEKQRNKWKIGDICASPFHGDESLVYYRTKVVNVDRLSSRNLLEVLFLDFGNTAFVKEEEVLAFTKAAYEVGIVDEPPLAMKCSLAKIQPSISEKLVGFWTKRAKDAFYEFLPSSKECILKIYSSVEGTLNVHLFKCKSPSEIHSKDDTNEENSLNNYLIKIGLALAAEEPYLSRDNNARREEAANRLDIAAYSHTTKKKPSIVFDQKYLYENMDRMVQLKGPFSPLEVKLNGATKKSITMKMQVDKLSVNSVLLDSYPMDTHERFIVASNVSEGFVSKSLTLRDTTVMPNIHGLYYLVTMLFSPFVELKHDALKTHYVGALCGLGYDPETMESYYPENEIKLNFDTVVDNTDLLKINKIRFYINYALKDSETGFNVALNDSKVSVAKTMLYQELQNLLIRRRESQHLGFVENSDVWGKGFDPNALLEAQLISDNENTDIFHLINGYKLETRERVFNPTLFKMNLQQIEDAVTLTETLNAPISCLFCKERFDKLRNLKMHVYTNGHKERVQRFNNLIELDGSLVQDKSIYHEFLTLDGEPSYSGASTVDKSISCVPSTSDNCSQAASTCDDTSTVGDLTDDQTSHFPETDDDAVTIKDDDESSIIESSTVDC